MEKNEDKKVHAPTVEVPGSHSPLPQDRLSVTPTEVGGDDIPGGTPEHNNGAPGDDAAPGVNAVSESVAGLHYNILVGRKWTHNAGSSTAAVVPAATVNSSSPGRANNTDKGRIPFHDEERRWLVQAHIIHPEISIKDVTKFFNEYIEGQSFGTGTPRPAREEKAIRSEVQNNNLIRKAKNMGPLKNAKKDRSKGIGADLFNRDAQTQTGGKRKIDEVEGASDEAPPPKKVNSGFKIKINRKIWDQTVSPTRTAQVDGTLENDGGDDHSKSTRKDRHKKKFSS